ncbi:PREDICTED: phosphatidylinositol-glycan biosynthesis class F protein, partial [Nestor notabilis]|uniref:phosphatidylinositol-glycan biosynthesis class F protein n=1 Tax=Nestor notabilis TaxID=176057 RepID=UPI00052343C1
MKVEVRRLLAANLLCVFSVILTAVVPAFFWDGFTVLGTHLAWLCICSVCVGTVNVILHLVLKPNHSPKRSSFAHK